MAFWESLRLRRGIGALLAVVVGLSLPTFAGSQGTQKRKDANEPILVAPPVVSNPSPRAPTGPRSNEPILGLEAIRIANTDTSTTYNIVLSSNPPRRGGVTVEPTASKTPSRFRASESTPIEIFAIVNNRRAKQNWAQNLRADLSKSGLVKFQILKTDDVREFTITWRDAFDVTKSVDVTVGARPKVTLGAPLEVPVGFIPSEALSVRGESFAQGKPLTKKVTLPVGLTLSRSLYLAILEYLRVQSNGGMAVPTPTPVDSNEPILGMPTAVSTGNQYTAGALPVFAPRPDLRESQVPCFIVQSLAQWQSTAGQFPGQSQRLHLQRLDVRTSPQQTTTRATFVVPNDGNTYVAWIYRPERNVFVSGQSGEGPGPVPTPPKKSGGRKPKRQ